MTFEGIYMLADLMGEGEQRFSGAPVPLLGKQKAVWANSHNLCLRGDLRGGLLDVAAQFISFLSNHSLQWAAGGQIPARRDLRDTAAFRRMTVQRAFASQIPYVDYPPSIFLEFEYQSELDIAVDRALRGASAPAAALETAARNIDAIIRREAGR